MVREALFFFVVLLLANSIGFSQTPQNQQRNRSESYGIRGKVVIPNVRDADQRLEVRLEKSAFQMIQTTYTDGSGNFEFRNLSPGGYYISINLEGYEPVHQFVEVFNTLGNASLTIMLSKPAVEFRERPRGLDAADPDVVDVSQMKENFPRKAVQNYEKALEVRRKGRIDEALKLLEEAVQIAPGFFHAHNNLGIVYQSLKRYSEAEREFKRSHQLSARSERPLINLGGMYIEQSNLQQGNREVRGKLLDQALDALEQAVKLNPRSAVAHLLLGQANYRSDFLEEAEAAFKKAQDLDPDLIAAQLMLANVYVKLQKWQEVIDTLDSYLVENPDAPDRAAVEETRARVAKNLEEATQRATRAQ